MPLQDTKELMHVHNSLYSFTELSSHYITAYKVLITSNSFRKNFRNVFSQTLACNQNNILHVFFDQFLLNNVRFRKFREKFHFREKLLPYFCKIFKKKLD
jgi:hypothetical protein